MFNRRKCLQCRFHGYLGCKDENKNNLCCDYSQLAHDGTCIKRGKGGDVIDRRENDPDDCQLFKSGKKLDAYRLNN